MPRELEVWVGMERVLGKQGNKSKEGESPEGYSF